MRWYLVCLCAYTFIHACQAYGMFSQTHVVQNVHVNSEPKQKKERGFSFNPSGAINGIGSFLNHNKYTFLILGLLSGYGYVSYTLYKGNSILQNGRSWSAWKYHIDFGQLSLTPQNELEKELLNDIQRQYINYENPTDFVSPLSSFAQDIEKEHQLLSRYIKWGGIILKCHVGFLFPVNIELIAQAHERLERLNFVRHIFISWSAHHNLEQNALLKNACKRVRVIR